MLTVGLLLTTACDRPPRPSVSHNSEPRLPVSPAFHRDQPTQPPIGGKSPRTQPTPPAEKSATSPHHLPARPLKRIAHPIKPAGHQGQPTTQRQSQSPKQDWHTTDFGTLVALGETNSNANGNGMTDGCWPTLLANMINDFQVTPLSGVHLGSSAGVISIRSPGYPYTDQPAASECLDEQVIAHQPDLLVLAYGSSDARSGTPVSLFQQELASLIDRVRQSGDPIIVLLGPHYIKNFSQEGPHWSFADPLVLRRYNEATRKVADQKNCLFVDVLEATDQADWMVHNDGVHQNHLAHRVVANRIFEILAQNCSCLVRQPPGNRGPR